jgi:hypothetical protein
MQHSYDGKMAMSDDKRQYPRFPSALETIYFTEIYTQDGDERMYFPGTITDKSAGGIGLRVNYQHETDERIWLEGLGTHNKPLPARVCWISTNDKDSEDYLMGVEFVLEEESRA